MAHVEIDRIEKRMTCQRLRCLRIFVCGNIKRYTGRPDGLEGAAVGESVPAGKLNRVDITTSELGNLRRRFLFSIVQRAKVQPLSLPAKIEDQAVVVSRALSVSVDLHNR